MLFVKTLLCQRFARRNCAAAKSHPKATTATLSHLRIISLFIGSTAFLGANSASFALSRYSFQGKKRSFLYKTNERFSRVIDLCYWFWNKRRNHFSSIKGLKSSGVKYRIIKAIRASDILFFS